MVVRTQARLRTIRGKTDEKECILDTGSRWTWIKKELADKLEIRATAIPRSARTADSREVQGFLAEDPLEIALNGFDVKLWTTPIVAEWLASDLIIGNDFMDKAGIRVVGERPQSYRPIGELYLLGCSR